MAGGSPPNAREHPGPPPVPNDPGGSASTGGAAIALTERRTDAPQRTAVTTPSDAQPTSDTMHPAISRPNHVTTAGPGGGRSYAAVVQGNGSARKRESRRPVARKLTNNFSPTVLDRLQDTLSKDWTSTRSPATNSELQTLYEVASAPSDVHPDAALRDPTPDEVAALLAYFNGKLELKHPPNFIKATMPVLRRAIVEQYHETHVEYTLTAVIPPSVSLWKNMPHVTLFAELLAANEEAIHGAAMISRMQQDVKILHYDGAQLLRFVFHSHRIAEFYAGITLRFRHTTLTLEDSERQREGQLPGAFNATQVRRLYSVRVLGAGKLGMVGLVSAFSQLAEVAVLDAQRPRDDAMALGDTRFVEIFFDQSTCPSALVNVTHVRLGSTEVRIHHHLRYQRSPCSRCYSPKHITGYCKVKPEHVAAAKRRGYRVFSGQVAPFNVGTAPTYCHSDGESLETFLATIEQELGLKELITQQAAQLIADNEPDEPSRGTSAAGHTSQSLPPADAAGYVVALSASAKKKAAAKKKQHQADQPVAAGRAETGTPIGESVGKRPQSTEGLAAERDPAATAPLVPLAKSVSAPGRYAVLQSDSEDDDEDDGVTHSDEEADYAYVSPREEDYAPVTRDSDGDVDMGAPVLPGDASGAPLTSVNHVLTTRYPDAPAAGVDATAGQRTSTQANSSAAEAHRRHARREHRRRETEESESRERVVKAKITRRDVDVVMAEEGVSHHTSSSLSSYVGSSAPSHSSQEASLPGSEIPFSVASSPGDLKSDELAQVQTPIDCQDASQSSTDSVQYLKTVGPPENPTQAQYWLSWFEGREVCVPYNGQCAVLALYATISNSDRDQLSLTSDVIADANYHKKAIYALSIANLQADCVLGLVNPVDDATRLNPDCPPPSSTEAATAVVCTHLLQERMRSVASQVPRTHWAGPHVLRACAQYLRLPLLVIDVDKNGDGHIQVYSYQTHEVLLPGCTTPEVHESGYCAVLKDADASDYLTRCGRLHVLPTFLLLKHGEKHFYGVHHGELYLKWMAEGDPAFASNVAHPYDWLEDYLMPHPDIEVRTLGQATRTSVGFEVLHDGEVLDLLDDTDCTNLHLLRGVPMRQRLDIVHLRMGWPILDEDPFDLDELEQRLDTAMRSIYATAGMDTYAVGARIASPRGEASPHLPTRTRPSSRSRMHASVYRTLLSAPGLDALSPALRIKQDVAEQANRAAHDAWCDGHGERFGVLEHGESKRDIPATLSLLDDRVEPLRHLFASLPYPELVAKSMSLSQLCRWGQAECYFSQIGAIERLSLDPERPSELREVCHTWLSQATGPDTASNLETAADANRWFAVGKWLAGTYLRHKPESIPEQQWLALHVLPYVIRPWGATVMGRTPLGSRAQWYIDHPILKSLCEQLLQGNWGDAVRLPTGLAWDEWEDTTLFLPPLSYRK